MTEIGERVGELDLDAIDRDIAQCSPYSAEQDAAILLTDLRGAVAEVKRLRGEVTTALREATECAKLVAVTARERDGRRAEHDALAARLAETEQAHELMARQFRTMQAEKEHGWREADRQESRADTAEAKLAEVAQELREMRERAQHN